MWLFKQYLTDLAEASIKQHLTLWSSTSFYHKSALQSYSAIVRFLLKHYVTDNNIAKLEVRVRNLRQGLMKLAELPQELSAKTLSWDHFMMRNLLRPYLWRALRIQFAGHSSIGGPSTNMPLCKTWHRRGVSSRPTRTTAAEGSDKRRATEILHWAQQYQDAGNADYEYGKKFIATSKPP